MKKTKNVIMKTIGKVIFNEAKKSANTTCPMFNYQPKAPKELKNLRKD